MSVAKLFLLVDHANIPFEKVSFIKLVTAWIEDLATSFELPSVLSLKVKAYGGWYVGNTASGERYRAAELYQRIVPTGLKVRGHLCRIRFEFADYLETLPANERYQPFAVHHTVSPRTRLLSIGWKTPIPTCQEPSCKIKEVHRWLHKDKACTLPTCPHPFSAFFERFEQKQVDVHLATDLVLLALAKEDNTHFGVISDDTDFMPSLVAAKRYGNATCSVS